MRPVLLRGGRCLRYTASTPALLSGTLLICSCVPQELRLGETDAGPAVESGVTDTGAEDVLVDAKPLEEAGDATSEGRSVKVLALGQGSPKAIAVVWTTVYWTTDTGVWSCDLSGYEPKPKLVASSEGVSEGLVVPALIPHWTNSTTGEVARAGVQPPSRFVIASNQGGPSGIAATPSDASDSVFWVNTDAGEVRQCALNLTTPCPDDGKVIALFQFGPRGIAATDEYVVWTSEGFGLYFGTIMRYQLSTTKLQTLADAQPHPWAITVDDKGKNVFWTALGADAGTGFVLKMSMSGGTPTVLASKQADPIGIAVDSTTVYWTNRASGQVMSCAIGGCDGGPTVLWEGSGTDPWGIAASPFGVAWTLADAGQIVVYSQ